MGKKDKLKPTYKPLSTNAHNYYDSKRWDTETYKINKNNNRNNT